MRNWDVNPDVGLTINTSEGNMNVNVCGRCGSVCFDHHIKLHDDFHARTTSLNTDDGTEGTITDSEAFDMGINLGGGYD